MNDKRINHQNEKFIKNKSNDFKNCYKAKQASKRKIDQKKEIERNLKMLTKKQTAKQKIH
jgi:hypothetical protein